MDIPYVRVDTDPAVTMEQCDIVDTHLHTRMVKTLLVCNRQQTAFYLFVTTGHKPFSTKDFGYTLGISRVSFANAAQLQRLMGTERGAATLWSVLLESSADVKIIIDRDVLKEAWYACSDGTTTGYMKVPTAALMEKLPAYTGRRFQMVEVLTAPTTV